MKLWLPDIETIGAEQFAELLRGHDAVLRDTDLDWTIVAPSGLTNDPGTGKVDHAATSETVPRADVAAVIVQWIADPSSKRRTLRFNSGEVPIDEYVQRNQGFCTSETRH